MTRFGPRIEPITSPTPGGCANSYATDAGFSKAIMKMQRNPICHQTDEVKNLFVKKTKGRGCSGQEIGLRPIKAQYNTI